MQNVPTVSPELPSQSWRLILTLIGKLPERALSRAFGRLADLNVPRWARQMVYGRFARAVGIDLSEVELPLEAYPSLNAFFVRKLRKGVRNWPADPNAIVSPVDGILGRFGRVEGGMAIQAKGHTYSVGDLIGDPKEANRFTDGSFLTIYLSPRHYHRIHTPCPGTIARANYLPGTLFPVNEAAVKHIPGLFVRNERLVCHLNTVHGTIVVVAVGAYNVGRISASFDASWNGSATRPHVTNRKPHAPFGVNRKYAPARIAQRGDEIMAFHLGSTVVLLFEPGVTLRRDLAPGMEVKVGELICS